MENGRNICEVTIVSISVEFYIIRFNDKGVKLRGSRLYAAQEEAERVLQKEERQERTGYWFLMITCIKLFFKRGLTDVTPFDILRIVNC